MKTRKIHTPEFKEKLELEAVRGVKTINEIDQEYGACILYWRAAFSRERVRL